MKVSKLTVDQAETLLALYNSNLKMLEFQLSKSKEVVAELEVHIQEKTKDKGTGKKRGRPPKVKNTRASATAKKKRGRPAKAKTEAVPLLPKRGRGRPAKVKSEVAPSMPKRRRGRPAKVRTEAIALPPKRKRGRPAKRKVVS